MLFQKRPDPPHDNLTEDEPPYGVLWIHRALFVRHPLLSLLAAAFVYASIILVFGDSLAVSSNYFVLLPVLAGALSFGFSGGVVSGALGLPANLVLFHILGHPEFSPASKLIAEASGIFVGSFLGYLAEYFRQLESEIRRRVRTERSLRAALEDNKLLLWELHHRVKNNLSVIKSLIQLQRNRSTDIEFLKAADTLLGRVHAIAHAHDRLHGTSEDEEIDPEEYIKEILAAFSGDGVDAPVLDIRISAGASRLEQNTAVPLGLIINEIVSNAIKHSSAEGAGTPRILLQLERRGPVWLLEIRDTGPGFDPAEENASGLGLKIVRGLAGQIKGRVSWAREDGTVFRLEFPAHPKTDRD